MNLECFFFRVNERIPIKSFIKINRPLDLESSYNALSLFKKVFSRHRSAMTTILSFDSNKRWVINDDHWRQNIKKLALVGFIIITVKLRKNKLYTRCYTLRFDASSNLFLSIFVNNFGLCCIGAMIFCEFSSEKLSMKSIFLLTLLS